MNDSGETTVELDPSELLRGWASLQTTPSENCPAVHVDVTWSARTDIGRVRENNEDKFDFFLPEDPSALATRGRLWAVADGMGGANAGQIASEAALKTIIRSYYSLQNAHREIHEALRMALSEANTLIFRAARQFEEKNGMGTTVVLAVIREDTLTIAHIGDSRAYLIRPGERIRALTTDHSWVEEQVRRGGMSRTEAEASPWRNVITRSVGMGDGLTADVINERLLPGDLIVLATDGLTGYLSDDALAAIVESKNPSRAALDLIDAANDAGGKDNITVLLLAIRDIQPFPAAPIIIAGEGDIGEVVV